MSIAQTAAFLIGNDAENARVDELRAWNTLRSNLRTMQADISACIADAIADVQDWAMENDLI